MAGIPSSQTLGMPAHTAVSLGMRSTPAHTAVHITAVTSSAAADRTLLNLPPGITIQPQASAAQEAAVAGGVTIKTERGEAAELTQVSSNQVLFQEGVFFLQNFLYFLFSCFTIFIFFIFSRFIFFFISYPCFSFFSLFNYIDFLMKKNKEQTI